MSLVGRVKLLEDGGANIEFLNRRPFSNFTDDIAKTNESIVANIYKIKSDYVKHSMSTNIAGFVATNVVDAKVTRDYIKDKGFYDKDQVDELIFEKVE